MSFAHVSFAPVAVYTGAGAGSFATPVISAAGNGVSSGSQADSIVAGDFNGGSETDLAFVTDNNLVDVMLATSGGSMSAATSLSLPSGHVAIGVTTVDYNNNGDTDLVVQTENTDLEEPLVALDLYTNDGSGDFTHTSTFQTVGNVDTGVTGLVAGDFQGSSIGLELAVPVMGDGAEYIDVVPLSSSGTWGNGVIHPLGNAGIGTTGNIVTADLNVSGKPSIALTDGTANIYVLLTDPREPRGDVRDRPQRQHRDGPLQQLRPVDQRDAL
jgi:FG-GAP-like repeat